MSSIGVNALEPGLVTRDAVTIRRVMIDVSVTASRQRNEHGYSLTVVITQNTSLLWIHVGKRLASPNMFPTGNSHSP